MTTTERPDRTLDQAMGMDDTEIAQLRERVERLGAQRLRQDGRLVDLAGCGQPFARGHMTHSWRNCRCTDGHGGHRLTICLRGECRAETPDPPCHGQTGPTTDYGGVTTHVPG